jgi:2-oxoglutarate dehydrogenase E2 component (dihydrolipoamide succinyltransferase)
VSDKIYNVAMPQMGESITQATILKWMKQPGDQVSRGETLLEISTEKVSADIPAAISGTLVEVLFGADETVDVDTIIARIAPVGVAAEVKAGVGGGAAAAKADQEAGGDDKVDDATKRAATTPSASRPTASAGAAAAGARPTAASVFGVSGGAKAGGNGAAATNDSATNGNGSANGHGASSDPVESERADRLRRRSTPLVRNIAADLGVDLAAVPGSGLHGRVTKRDLLAFVEQGGTAAAPLTKVGATHTAAPAAPGLDAVREPLSLMRRKIAEHMVASKHTSPHAYTVFEIDMTRIEALRRRLRDTIQRDRGVRLTPLAFVASAVAETLPRFRSLNASMDGNDVLYHRRVNLAIAVALDDGLIVPVIRAADGMNTFGIAAALGDLAARARAKKLAPADVTGGTFTITSPGQLGALMGTPIINQPQSAILHVGALQRVPVVVEDNEGNEMIAIRTRCLMTLGLDHRLIDGWEADTFMAAIKKRLEDADFGLE